MLVLSNGAPKCGSTWLFCILRAMTEFPPPPKEYWNPRWEDSPVVHSIDPEKLSRFLKQVDCSSSNYLSKNHFGRKDHRDLLLSCEDVLILDIERDIRDVLVSAYYHFQKLGDQNVSFDTYYWEKGRRFVRRVIRFHQVWRTNSPRVYTSSYENLKLDFHVETGRIAKFLGIEASARRIEDIERETSFEELRKRSGTWNDRSGRFRKGTIGDWQRHLDAEMLEDIERIEKELSNPLRRALSELVSVPRRWYRQNRKSSE